MDGKLASLALTNAAGRTLSAALREDYDANGNVTAYRTETRGYAAQYAYDAFGNMVTFTGPMAEFFAHGFSTKYYDFEPDLYYYGYRFYSPVLGRWISRDPIGEDGGNNLYQTVFNDLVSQIDYLGDRISMVTSTNDNTITISISVTMQIVFPCSGPDLQKKAEAIRDKIIERWSQSASKKGKTYKLHFSKFIIVAVTHDDKSSWLSDYHTFNLVEKDDVFNNETKKWEVSHVDKPGGCYSEVFKAHHGRLETYVHEFGHMLGLNDLYIERERMNIFTGKMERTTEADSRFPNHIMSDGGTNVSVAEMIQLSTQDKSKYNIGLPVLWR